MTFHGDGRAAGTAAFDLADGDIHVWRVGLQVDDAVAAGLRPLLCATELIRAGRFRFDVDRRRFVVCRAWLRKILGSYLRTPPAGLDFIYGPRGKPFLRSGALQFNVAHSEDLALIACCGTAALGIDLERIREMPDAEQVVRRFFAPEEAAQWIALAPEARTRAFFDCWTRKEAYVKAVGDGLFRPLDAFRVSFRRGESPHLVLPEEEGRAWSLFDVSPAADYAGALAAPGAGWTVRTWTLPDLDGAIQ